MSNNHKEYRDKKLRDYFTSTPKEANIRNKTNASKKIPAMDEPEEYKIEKESSFKQGYLLASKILSGDIRKEANLAGLALAGGLGGAALGGYYGNTLVDEGRDDYVQQAGDIKNDYKTEMANLQNQLMGMNTQHRQAIQDFAEQQRDVYSQLQNLPAQQQQELIDLAWNVNNPMKSTAITALKGAGLGATAIPALSMIKKLTKALH